MKYLENLKPCIERLEQKSLDNKQIRKNQNTYRAKLTRILNSKKPIALNRRGSCRRCGECCKLPNRCIFLAYNENDQAICHIYAIPLKPAVCRKYPRTEKEFITQETCGYWFSDE